MKYNMLLAFFRGAFLIGILAWYSLSVWKMIDGYFRDQFASYLHEEYRKNPRMKSDIQDIDAMNKSNSVVTDVEPSLDKMVELEAEGYSDDNTDADKTIEPSEILKNEEILTNEEIKEPEDEIIPPIEIKENPKSDDPKNEEEVIVEKKKRISLKKLKEEVPRRGKKRRVKTITLKEEDFLSVKKRRSAIERDEDFWEFEEDEEEGIPVASLPYKPRLDIGKLERVTVEEYCPLTLEDEFSCGETTEWP